MGAIWPVSGFCRAAPAATGRPGYDPRDLPKLCIWGYFNEIRSSRRLERACRRDVEAMWRLCTLAPDVRTIADFRRDTGPAIIGACRAFVLLCRDAGLFAARLLALDGSTFRAAAGRTKVMGRREIAEEAARLDRRIAFVCDPGTDAHLCPGGRRLARKELNRKARAIPFASPDGSGCALKARCTTAERRFVTRHRDAEAMARMAARATPEMMRIRRCAAEHPFGTIKRMMAGGRVLTRNRKGTRTGMAVAVRACNIRRAVSLGGETA